ncbi:diaminopimelate epimerase [Calorimonas adulescens]|uniref:Diaminopimelate epimerase n=1 Tax=Calorimonas adulescens TaxID=2606906 RepID=A0A5D8QFZ1_9THEO|nr:diaminopimelate epimerase [Calorimonas adulescens]TZE83421.1 diaminopimelate epimerase [Calorimonas adulescens]
MEFVKMHGTGNDFILINEVEVGWQDIGNIAKRLCDRHFGIGADGLILVCKSNKFDARMRIINADGSEAEMCGNGIRCFAKYVYDRKIVTKKKMEIETLSGVVRPEVVTDDNDKVRMVRVDMGVPHLEPDSVPVRWEGRLINEPIAFGDKTLHISSVNTGVPHTVIFVSDIDSFPIEVYGPVIEKYNIFPVGTNVNFVQVMNRKRLMVRTWERGVGMTMACGSGACASAFISNVLGYIEREVIVSLPGGDLFVEVNNNIYMTGPCVEVFHGDISLWS